MYYIYGRSGPSLLIESTDSIIMVWVNVHNLQTMLTHLFSIKLEHIQNNRRIIPLWFNLYASNCKHTIVPKINRLHTHKAVCLEVRGSIKSCLLQWRWRFLSTREVKWNYRKECIQQEMRWYITSGPFDIIILIHILLKWSTILRLKSTYSHSSFLWLHIIVIICADLILTTT